MKKVLVTGKGTYNGPMYVYPGQILFRRESDGCFSYESDKNVLFELSGIEYIEENCLLRIF